MAASIESAKSTAWAPLPAILHNALQIADAQAVRADLGSDLPDS